jgi:hypothetical protein
VKHEIINAWNDKRRIVGVRIHNLNDPVTGTDSAGPDPFQQIKFNDSTSYDNDSTFNMSLADTSDWSAEMTNSVSVSMSKKLSLRVSLRWLYNSEPALEDVDVSAQVELRDPDGVPGSGDEFYETVEQGGIEVALGESSVRKDELDQIFKATLVVSF